MRLSAVAVVVCAVGIPGWLADTAGARTWTDDTGAFQVEADLVSVNGNNVTLKKPDGQVVAVPLNRLSADDRKFVADYLKELKNPQQPVKSEKPAVDKALEAEVQAEFVETPLSEALRFLSSQAKVPILIREVPTDTPVTINTEGKLHDVLTSVLTPLKLKYTVYSDAIIVTDSRTLGRRYLVPRVYRLRMEVPMDDVLDTVTTTVDPNTWADVGGPAAISPVSARAFVVLQSWPVHREMVTRFGDMLEFLPPPARTSKLDQALAKPITVQLLETPLQDAVMFLENVAGLKITLDLAALSDAGVGSDSPVSFNAKDMPASSVLSLLLDELNLVWLRDDNQVSITSPQALKTQLKNVRYGLQGISARPDGLDVLEAIKDTVFPTSWDEVGGPAKSRAVLPGQVVILQHDVAQRQIEDVLGALKLVNSK